MATNQSDKVTPASGASGYAFDKVVFQSGKPILDTELNLAQEQLELLTQKSTAHMPSGWLSYRPYYTSKDITNGFYTQDPTGAKPEMALVNGWPVYVTNTNTPLKHVNKILFNDNELRSGSRVDGVFLEVWRSVVTPQIKSAITVETSKPQPVIKVSTINGVHMYNENIGWAVGDNGTILKTSDGGNNWITVDTPINMNFKKVKFYGLEIGYAISDKGQIVKSLDGGASWFTLSTPVNDDLNDLYLIDAQRVCIVGNNGTILLSIDGTHFNTVSQSSSNTSNLYGVTFFDTSVGWAVGASGTLLMTKDGGNIWQRYSVTDNATSTQVTQSLYSVAFYNLNDGVISGSDGLILRTSDSGFTWSNMSDRIWSDGAYKTIQDIYPGRTINFNRIFIREEFAIRLVIGVYSYAPKVYFKNLMYKISPANYPNSLVLEFTGTQDNINYIKVLDLDAYATAEDLSTAINNQISAYRSDDAYLPDAQRQKIRVFESSIDYEPSNVGKPSDFRPSSGSFSSMSPAQLSFSVEDKAWIAGDSGVALISNNSGSKWEVLDIGTGYDMYDIFFVSDTKGWFTGAEGTVVQYNASVIPPAETQSTDLVTKVQGRIFPEGNVLSNAEEYLTDNIIDPQVGVETTRRVQIQYRIRIAEGVDPFQHPESGLGHEYVYSQGFNANTSEAGNYIFENMGPENGDYGLWRARCRGTYDGYSWAIPMFFVSKRNSGAFNVDSNINGSTYFDLNAIRPDGLTYEQIVDDDVTDIRRQIVVQSYSALLQKNLEKLLSNNLKTSVSDKDQRGLQYGTSILMSDQYTGTNDIPSLVRGGVSSSAVLVEDVKLLDPNILITTAELTFGPRDDGLYHNDLSYYSAYVKRGTVVTSEPVPGTFEGLGTDTVVFHIADNYTPSGGTLTGVQYQITATLIDYSRVGLSRVPKTPISVKYQSNPVNVGETYYFNGINSRSDSKILETLTENVPGYVDYTRLYSAKVVLDNDQDKFLYELLGHTPMVDPDAQKSLRKYEGQQFRGSLVEYHYFTQTTTATSILRIPKNLNGYAIYGVRSVRNVNGASYKISVDFAGDMSLRDREVVDASLVKDNVVVYLDEAFTIPANAVLEVILEACVPSSALGMTPSVDTGITVQSKGENQEALRTSFTANFSPASKAVSGMYIGILYPISLTTLTTTITVDLSSLPAGSTLLNGTVLGLISCETKEIVQQPYLWYQASSLPVQNDYFTMAPIAAVTGLGTSTVTISVDPRKPLNGGKIQIPLLVKLANLPGTVANSVATVFYKYIPYQTVGNLPEELILEVVNMSEQVFITNLGTGASEIVRGEPYEVPAEHIAVNDDSVKNDNMFSNVDDMEFSNFTIPTGFVRMPGILSQYIGEDIVLSRPNNVGDKVGRTYYSSCSVDVIAQAENMVTSTPRKVFVPMIARVRSDVLYPVMRGELVLVIFSKVYKARIENKTGFYEDEDAEYKPGYIEQTEPSIAIYRLTNKPLLRK